VSKRPSNQLFELSLINGAIDKALGFGFSRRIRADSGEICHGIKLLNKLLSN
jgi:hypothetical protein